ncbi:hypothetical protein PAPHI01_0843 [Pancytospora philotis]|nr:hypothetical protein PAPHI01_0843 [Pancytospora philotis]
MVEADSCAEGCCGICKEALDVPHALPCEHSFCFLCIAKHLGLRDFCPTCRTGPYRMNALSTAHVPMAVPRLPEQVFKRTEANYIKILKKHRVSTDGTYAQLEARFAELTRQVLLEQFREKPRSDVSIAWSVNRLIGGGQRKHSRDMRKIYKSLAELRKKAGEKHLRRDI